MNCGLQKVKSSQGQIAHLAQINARPKGPVGSAFQEAVKAAGIIGQSAVFLKQPLVLCMSGGIDSEATALSFLCSGVPFRVVIMRFKEALNDFDIGPALAFCKKQKIRHEIFELSPEAFFESGKYLEYGKKYRCQSPQLALHLYLLDHIEGLPVLCWQAPEILYSSEQKSLGLPGDLHTVFSRYFKANKRPGIPFFFLYTPELYAAFFHTPFVQTLIWFGERGAKVTNFYEHKCMAYIQGGFPVRPRAHPYTGFEKLRELYDKKEGKSFGTAFDDRFRKPLEKMNPLPKKHYQFVPDEICFHPGEIQKLKARFEPQLLEGKDIQTLFQEEMEGFYRDSRLNMIVDSKGNERDRRLEEILSSFNPLQMRSKLWLCRKIEKEAPGILKGKSAVVLILASWYGLMSFLILSRGVLKVKKLKNCEIDPFVLGISKDLNSFWLKEGVLECFLTDGNIPLSPVPDIVINTGCEHFKNYDWLKKIPKGVLCALQANDIPHDKHPKAVSSLSEFKKAARRAGLSEILHENEETGELKKTTSAPFRHFMLIGRK